MNVQAYTSWRQSKTGLIVFVIIYMLFAYRFALWSIDSGNLLDYLLTIVFIAAAVYDAVRLVKVFKHGR